MGFASYLIKNQLATSTTAKLKLCAFPSSLFSLKPLEFKHYITEYLRSPIAAFITYVAQPYVLNGFGMTITSWLHCPTKMGKTKKRDDSDTAPQSPL